MNKYTAEQVERIAEFHEQVRLENVERRDKLADKSADMLRDYADLLREHESAKAAVIGKWHLCALNDGLFIAECVPIEQPRAVQDGWISVADRLPKCSSKPNSFGTCVLIYPNYKSEGASDMPIAFYGRRQTNEPNFYIHGCVLNHVTHWMPLPAAPQSR